MPEPPGDDDAELVRRVAEDRDKAAFGELMKRHAPKATGHLLAHFKFRRVLQDADIHDAINIAALKAWEKARTFDREKGKSFGAWFLSIAHNAAMDILRGAKKEEADLSKLGESYRPGAKRNRADLSKRSEHGEVSDDPPDPAQAGPDQEGDDDDDNPGGNKRAQRVAWYVDQMKQIITEELRGFEQLLAQADLAAGGRADTELLMKQHDKTKNVVQATRSKVWKKIREIIGEREAQWKVNQ